MSGIPLVVVERMWREPDHATRIGADVRVGGHPGTIVLDFAQRELIVEYVQVPRVLDLHTPSVRAVIDLMDRFERGETIALPVDLSDEIRRRAPHQPSPFDDKPEAERAALDAAADRIGVVIESAARDAANPRRVTAVLRVDGQSHRIVAEVWADEGTKPFLSVLEGPRFNQPPELAYAIFRALVSAWRNPTQ